MALLFNTDPGPSIGSIERTIGMNPVDYSSVNGLVAGTTQTILMGPVQTKTPIYSLYLFNSAGTATTHTLRKKLMTAADSNEQRLSVTKSVAANSADTALTTNGPHPVMILNPGEALYITASQANALLYNITSGAER